MLQNAVFRIKQLLQEFKLQLVLYKNIFLFISMTQSPGLQQLTIQSMQAGALSEVVQSPIKKDISLTNPNSKGHTPDRSVDNTSLQIEAGGSGSGGGNAQIKTSDQMARNKRPSLTNHSFIAQQTQLSEIAMKNQTERHRMDQEFAAAATGQANSGSKRQSPVLQTIVTNSAGDDGSDDELRNGNAVRPNSRNAKNSQYRQSSSHLQQQQQQQQNRQHCSTTVANQNLRHSGGLLASSYQGAHQTTLTFPADAIAASAQQNPQFRSFMGPVSKNNQITGGTAAINIGGTTSPPPFISKNTYTGGAGSTLGLLNPNSKTVPKQQQPPQWINGRASKYHQPTHKSDPRGNDSNMEPYRQEMNRASETRGTVSSGGAANSAGRKTRVKSGRKRRFSSTSINNQRGGVTIDTSQEGPTAGSIGGNIKTTVTTASKMVGIQNSAGEIARGQNADHRFNQRTGGSAQVTHNAAIKMQNVVDMSQSVLNRHNKYGGISMARNDGKEQNLSSHYGTQKLVNSGDTLNNQSKKYSSSVNRRNQRDFNSHMGNEPYSATIPQVNKTNQSVVEVDNYNIMKTLNDSNCMEGGAEQATSINMLETESQDPHVQNQSNKQFSTMRNSKSLSKKISSSGPKKIKKLKKSESQVRNQHQKPKSELMTQQMRSTEEGELGTGEAFQSLVGGYQPSLYKHGQATPKGFEHVKRIQNRTPQNFSDALKGANCLGTGSNSLVREMHVTTGQGAWTELQMNAMHIKKLNFANQQPTKQGIVQVQRQMQSHPTQPVIAKEQYNSMLGYNRPVNQNANGPQTLDALQQLQMVLQNQAKEISGLQTQTKQGHNAQTSAERHHIFNQYNQKMLGQVPPTTAHKAGSANSTIDPMIIKQQPPQPQTQASKNTNSSFYDFNAKLASQVQPAVHQQNQQNNYKLMKAAERGEINTSSFVMCNQSHEKSNGLVTTKSPCTCSSKITNGLSSSKGGQSHLVQQKSSFSGVNYAYNSGSSHHRPNNDFSTIQPTKQSTSCNAHSNGQSPFAASSTATQQYPHANINTTAQPTHQQPHITQGKREDVNKFGGNFANLAAASAAVQQQQQQPPIQVTRGLQENPAMNPMMNDLLQYLQKAYQNQQESIGNNPAAVSNTMCVPPMTPVQEQLKHRMLHNRAQHSGLNMNPTQPTENSTSTFNPMILPQQQRSAMSKHKEESKDNQNNKMIHFEKGDRIIYEPNEMHQLKYINDKGEVTPITGVQYILTQPNFSKGRPCHFFVVNKQEFEAATKGFKQKQEEQERIKAAEELARQKKQQAVANIRSHRASQKLRTQNGKGKKGERKQSAKGGRDKSEATKEEKKEEKNKYHNENYTYQKLRSLKWMGGPYKNPHDEPAPIWRPSAEEQELRQQLEAKREIKAKYNLLSLNKQTETTELYKYILLLGNNQDVVKRVMDSRPSWVQIKSSQTLYNFKWAPSSRQIKFDFLGKHGQKNLVNHFENHALITTKDQLITSMSKLYENMHQDVFDAIPITFVIDLGTPLCQQEFDKFCYYFNICEKYKDPCREASDDQQRQDIVKTMNRNLQQHHALSEKKRKHTTVTMRDTLYNGHNMWLFKPADANRGRGVNLFDSIDQLKRLILEHTSRAESKQFQNFAHANNLHAAVNGQFSQPATNQQPSFNQQESIINTQQTPSAAGAGQQSISRQEPALGTAATEKSTKEPTMNQASVKSDVFVLQKYIERPLLINQRKFDIRLWVMITPDHKCFYFKEGYIRMSGQKYDLNQLDNLVIHLTNNAIQKHTVNYGQYEEGNILSFNEGAEFLRSQDGLEFDFYKLLREEILPIIEATMMSVRQKINKNNRRFCMEIFGYDFMVDQALRPWLIEVNTNPCLEESNQLLRNLIPRMLDDAFKLTLDVMYPPMPTTKIAEALGEEPESITSNKIGTFPVPGYQDHENLWGDTPFYILRVPGSVQIQGS